MFPTPISQQLQNLNQWIDTAECSLANKPTGSLILHQSHGTVQYLFKDDSSSRYTRYIPKEEKDLINDLIQKDYDQKFLRQAYKIRKQLCSLYNHHASRSASFLYRPLGSIFENLPDARKQHVEPYVLPDEQFIEKWLSTPFDEGFFTPEQPMILTETGIRVRSKSEKIIADKYSLLGIPYLYEKPITLRDLGSIHPDFTLLDINERTTVIHEHFGLMQDQEYCEKAMYKIDCYMRSGYQQGVSFLATYEGVDHVLDTKAFELMIRYRFDNVK